MPTFDLRLSTGRVVVWEGASGEDAARAYVASHGATVVAWRHANRHGVINEHHAERMDRVRILEPGDPGWGKRWLR